MNIKIGHIKLFVNDAHKSKDFYAHVLGFEVVVVQGEQLVWVKASEMEILLREEEAPSPAPSYAKTGAGIVLYSDDLPATLQSY